MKGRALKRPFLILKIHKQRLINPHSCRSEPNAVELKSAIREHLLNLSNELSTSIKLVIIKYRYIPLNLYERNNKKQLRLLVADPIVMTEW